MNSLLLAGALIALTGPAESSNVPANDRVPWEKLGAETVRRNEAGQLVWLTITGPAIDDEVLKNSSELRTLQVLVLGNTNGGKGCRLSDAALTHIDRSKGLVTLQLRGRCFTDLALSRVSQLTNLRNVELSCTRVTDDGLKRLRRLPLESLSLRGTKITGRGLSSISRCGSLVDLDLEGTAVDDKSLENISGLARLNTLNLNRTGIGDSGLKHIARLSALRRLDLDGTSVSDLGIKHHIGSLTKLESLSLDGTKVTDAIVDVLSKLANLQQLDLSDTNVTTRAIETLRKRLPHANIWGGNSEEDDGEQEKG